MKGEFEKTVQHLKVRKHHSRVFSVQVYHHYTQLWFHYLHIKDEVYIVVNAKHAICFWVWYVRCSAFLLELDDVLVLMCVAEMIEVMWFAFSLKLSTTERQINSSLRSFISFSEMKKKATITARAMRGARRSRWWRRSWKEMNRLSQLFHTQSKTRRRWWTAIDAASKGLISASSIDRLIEFFDDKWCVLFCRSFSHDGRWVTLLMSLVLSVSDPNALRFWSWMFFQSTDLRAGSTDAFWSFDSCATILWATCPSESGRRCRTLSKNSESGRRSVLLQYTGNDAWGNIYRFQHYVWIPDELLHQNEPKQEKNNFNPHDIYSRSRFPVWLIIKYRIFTVITLRVELDPNHDLFFLNRDHDYLMILNKTK